MTKCSGCNGQFELVYQYEDTGANLCIDCWSKLEQTNEMVVRRLERQINYQHDRMDSVAGIRTGGRYATPPPSIHVDSPTMNSFNFSQSVIGSVNTGYIHDLIVNMNKVAINNSKDSAQTIKTFTHALLKSKEIEKKKKEKIIQQLSFLSEQLALSKQKRNDPIISVVLQDIANTITIITGLSTAFIAVKALF